MTTEPAWLTWTRELQAMAQTGLAFVRDPYDREQRPDRSGQSLGVRASM